MLTVKRIIREKGENARDDKEMDEEIQKECFITFQDFVDASKRIQPTAKREGFSTVPGTTWADVGALKELREELEISICLPIKVPEM